MVAGALAQLGLLGAGLSIPALFGVAAVMNAAVALYIYRLVPEFLLRFIVWMLIHTVYRLRTRGLGQIPEEGPAVLVCNHVSFVDALVIAAACRRPIRFVMDHRVFHWPLLSFVFRHSRGDPDRARKGRRGDAEAAFAEVSRPSRRARAGRPVPEGQITSDGETRRLPAGHHAHPRGQTRCPSCTELRGLWGACSPARMALP